VNAPASSAASNSEIRASIRSGLNPSLTVKIVSLASPRRNSSTLALRPSRSFSYSALLLSSCRLVSFNARWRWESLCNCLLPRPLLSTRVTEPLRTAFWRTPPSRKLSSTSEIRLRSSPLCEALILSS